MTTFNKSLFRHVMIDSDEKIITLIIFYFLIFRLLNPVYGASIDELWKQRESNIQ